MRKILLLVVLAWSFSTTNSQNAKPVDNKPSFTRPKLVVGIVVDQMRWDFLYRYTARYKPDGGFKRMLGQGFSCENTFIPYIPTKTACGHTCIYTGSVPAVHGIVGNEWWDNNLMRDVYCTEDNNAKTVGSTDEAGEMSPRNMLATSICDELRLATNFNSKVVGVAIKDRGAILPAGHSANAAYWFDSKSGYWITSNYYMNDLPGWVTDLNGKKLYNKYFEGGWNTLYPINSYAQSTEDVKEYEGKPFGTDQKGFPYDLKRFIDKNPGAIAVTPFGNSFTLDMAKAALTNEKLGADDFTDFLAISLSSTDYVGHTFGPNSVEIADTYLRLDQDLGDFLNFLDEKVGKDQYLVFLSADHGVSQAPGFLKEHNFPGVAVDETRIFRELGLIMKDKFGSDKIIDAYDNSQVYLNHTTIDSLRLNEVAIRKAIINYFKFRNGVSRIVELDNLGNTPVPAKIKEMIVNGYFPKRCGDIQVIFDPHWVNVGAVGTSHGMWNPYDSHIPLLWYGWNIKPGKTNREVYMTDIAPTIAALLRIQMPSGCIGHVIEEVTK
ncbi:MAG: alkaline phosphatase family protein [Bacteroidetes bacterium]|nr:MAG: alkaline phosphatase family protein [Bacteroidota bacterium]